MNMPDVVGMDMVSFMQRFSTDERCRAFLEWLRWPNGPACPKCGSGGTRVPGHQPAGWLGCSVGTCKSQSCVTAGTPLHRTRVPLTKWFLLMAPGGADRMSSASSKGISGMDTQPRVPARKLSEWLDVDYRTA